MSIKLEVATEDRICNCCNGVIPKGHRYWTNSNSYFSNSETSAVEHTNCEIYTADYNHKRGNQTHVS